MEGPQFPLELPNLPPAPPSATHPSGAPGLTSLAPQGRNQLSSSPETEQNSPTHSFLSHPLSSLLAATLGPDTLAGLGGLRCCPVGGRGLFTFSGNAAKAEAVQHEGTALLNSGHLCTA